jgi:hypothetical protein
MYSARQRVHAGSGARSHTADAGVIVVSPGARNDYYHGYATRIGRALGGLGFRVLCCEVGEIPEGSLDLCILSGLTEILRENGGVSVMRLLRTVRKRTQVLLSLSVEPVTSTWFMSNLRASVRVGADAIVDSGILSQNDRPLRKRRMPYHHIFDGLLRAEAESHDAAPAPSLNDRPLPWAQLGIKNQERIRLADLLVTEFDAGGLVYLCDSAALVDLGCSPWNGSQVAQILYLTKFHIWIGQSNGLYYESLRYRRSVSAGCAAIKVIDNLVEIPDDAPLADSLVREEDLIATLRSSRFHERAEQLRADYLGRPRVEDELSRLLTAFGLHHGPQSAHSSVRHGSSRIGGLLTRPASVNRPTESMNECGQIDG